MQRRVGAGGEEGGGGLGGSVESAEEEEDGRNKMASVAEGRRITLLFFAIRDI